MHVAGKTAIEETAEVGPQSQRLRLQHHGPGVATPPTLAA